MTENHIKTVLPIYNSEEKVDEINRLLDILSKRKRSSILVAMLLVFQKYNFQKLLKEFLIEGVQQIILANPFKVVSFSGVPFTIKNCLMGMRVIIGKHRVFQRETFEGYEYLNVNLVYTCIFLTDEIAKICKGSKNSKPVHSSLLDELDIVESGTNNNSGIGIQSGILNNINSNNNINNKDFLNEKRARNTNNSELDNYSLDLDEEGMEPSENKLTNNNLEGSQINNSINIEQKTNDIYSNSNVNITFPKNNENIISIGDSDESDYNESNNHKVKNNTKIRKRAHNKNNNHTNNSNNKNNSNQLFANIFYPKDNNYFRCPLQDYLTVWNFDRASPVNVYLKDNLQNILKIKNIFNLMQSIGSQGKNFLEKLMKFIPELNRASSLYQKDSEEIKEDEEDLKESKEILDKIENINNIYKEYENKKKKLINIYQRIKTTVENIKQSAMGTEKLFINDDIQYLKTINTRFNQIITEIIPLFNKLCDYNKECSLKNISINLQNVSRILKENDLTLKPFSGFTQGLSVLFPPQPSSINTVNDLMLNETLSVKEREDKFCEIISKEKDYLMNSIESFMKNLEDTNKNQINTCDKNKLEKKNINNNQENINDN